MTRALLSTLGLMPPAASARIAYGLFGFPGRRRPVQARDSLVHESARAWSSRTEGHRVTVYSWGSGAEIILLVHGWHSRASDLSPLVTTLQRPDRTILTFDAPGNGASSGRKVTVLDYARVIRELSGRYGPFRAMVSHSFGTLAAFHALNTGAQADRLVSIAGVHSCERLVEAFANQLGLSRPALTSFKRQLEEKTFSEVCRPWQSLVSELTTPADAKSMLLIHDDEDKVVDPADMRLIANAHPGTQVDRLSTTGLGHSRILADPRVLSTVDGFIMS